MKRLPAFVFLLLALAALVPDVAGGNNSKATVKTIIFQLIQTFFKNPEGRHRI
jgi:hypothetical protein